MEALPGSRPCAVWAQVLGEAWLPGSLSKPGSKAVAGFNHKPGSKHVPVLKIPGYPVPAATPVARFKHARFAPGYYLAPSKYIYIYIYM